jgi:hypothetical protein
VNSVLFSRLDFLVTPGDQVRLPLLSWFGFPVVTPFTLSVPIVG